jgi:MFS transporter, DHA2 family, multidrug resistance protein
MATARTWIGYVAMCIGMFMAILDIQVVASSLTNIQAALHIPNDQLSWLQTAYLMAEVIAIPLTGWLTRAIGLRALFTLATLGFTIGSALCAMCTSADPLIAVRVLQGFCGGMLIPAVFTSVFTILPRKHEVLATTLAGITAMIAPTIGPTVGGWITQTYSWHWIFLINIVPGLLVSAVVWAFIRSEATDRTLLRRISYTTIILASVFLASLELLLKEAPERHWSGLLVTVLVIVCPVSGALSLYTCLTAKNPFIDLSRFKSGAFSVSCALSFILGIGLYGSTYITAIFLGLVRKHGPFDIGLIMMVAGVAQLIAAPIAAFAETRINGRILTFAGYGIFAIGIFMNAFMTYDTDYAGFFWPQVVRGVAIMLCILPTTRLAMEQWPPDEAPDASGLFNLMRNLGGAIGLALIDTILEQRTRGHADALISKLQAGDANTARFVGLPVEYFHGQPMGPIDPSIRAYVEPLIQRAAFVVSFNEAWLLIGVLFLISMLFVPFVRGKSTVPTETI